MYPRNAASPEPISIGPVIQTSDGVVQTSGVTVRIKPKGVAEADGVGSVSYSTDGIVIYTPTQAETNYSSFILIAKKTGCIPTSVTVITVDSTVIAGAGTGARMVAITVDDGTDPLEGAKVRLTKGVESYVLSTDVNGEATFNTDDGTWTVAITLFGYSFSSTTLVVNGDETVTYSMSQTAVPLPSSPSMSVGILLCVDTAGDPEADVEVEFKLRSGPTGETGTSYDVQVFSELSDVNGMITSQFVRQATYRGRRSDGTWVNFTVPNTDSFNLPQVLGKAN